MTHRLKGISCAVVCLLLTAAGTVSASPHDVTPGMRISDAIRVVKRCIVESTAFRDPRDIQHRELRAEDTLEYAGITDTARLNAFRRYLVRNSDFGVIGTWGVRFVDDGPRPYIIPNAALAKIEKTWTIEKTAREIIGEAGLPFMTYAKAAQIVANCREDAKPSPAPPPPPPPPPPTVTNIHSDLNSAQRVTFVTCLTTNPRRGIESSGVTDGEGDFYPYVAARLAPDVVTIVNTNQTYGDLITLLHDKAETDLSRDLTASIVGRKWLIATKVAGCVSVSFPIQTYCQPNMPFIDANVTWDTAPLSGFGVAATSSVPFAFPSYRTKRGLTAAGSMNVTITPTMTIKEFIKEIRKQL